MAIGIKHIECDEGARDRSASVVLVVPAAFHVGVTWVALEFELPDRHLAMPRELKLLRHACAVRKAMLLNFKLAHRHLQFGVGAHGVVGNVARCSEQAQNGDRDAGH